MLSTFDHTRTHFIHDFDGVHYSFGDYKKAAEFFAAQMAEAAQTLLPQLSYSDAFNLGAESYKEHQDGTHKFLDLAQASGHDVEAFRRELHILRHRLAMKNAALHFPEWFEPCIKTQEAMAGLHKLGVRHAIVSHGTIDEWAVPILEKKGLSAYFDRAAMFGHEDLDFKNKGNSPKPLEIGLQALGVEPSRAVFIEDTPENFMAAKAYFPEICTVQVGLKDPSPYEGSIDYRFPTYRDFAQFALKKHTAPRYDGP